MRWLLVLSTVVACGGEPAADDGGDDGMVQPGDPVIVEFTSAAEQIDRGQTVELRWKVENAKSVTIFSATEVLVTTAQLEGSVTTLPLRRKASFTIKAIGTGPAAGRTISVDVLWPEPSIGSFSANPEMTFVQGFTTLTWTTEEVETVKIFANGNPVPNATFEGPAAASFSFSAFIQTTTTTFMLEASNPSHTITRELTIYAIDPPMIRSFSVSPRSFVGSSTIATVRWEATGFDRMELSSSLGFLPNAPPTLIGEYQVEVSWTTDFYLTGWFQNQPYGSGYATIGRAGIEYEPNDDPLMAQYISYEGGVSGNVNRTGDVDYFYYDHYQPFGLRLWIQGENGDCPTDTSIELIEQFSGTVIAMDEDDGIPTGRGGACPELSPEKDPALLTLVGSYYVVVRGQRGETGSYALLSDYVPRE
jgi:hypothetical protein